MRYKYILPFLMAIATAPVYGKTWTITNSGTTFTPSSLTIQQGDDVVFSLDGSHNSVEVSQATYNANGNTALSGGWSTAYGGGTVSAAKLTVGTHYYVCTPHAFMGMKGTITVQVATQLNESGEEVQPSVFPNPSNGIFTLSVGDNLIGTRYVLNDLTGKQVAQGTISENSSVIDITKAASGLYLFNIEGIRQKTIKLTKR